VVVRALEFVFTGGRVAGSAPALGTWLAVGCALVLVVGGVLALSEKGGSERDSQV
jgi:hypothetical protein